MPDSDDEEETESQKSSENTIRSHDERQLNCPSTQRAGALGSKRLSGEGSLGGSENVGFERNPREPENGSLSLRLSTIASGEDNLSPIHNRGKKNPAIDIHGSFEDIDELQQDDCFRELGSRPNDARTKVVVVIEPLGERDAASRLSDPYHQNQSTQRPVMRTSASQGEPMSQCLGTQSSSLSSAPNDSCDDQEFNANSAAAGRTAYPEHTDEIPESRRSNMSPHGGRNLRRRNPAQLHPYTAELEQYRRSLRARGLQPVQIAQSQRACRSPSPPDEDSLNDASASSSQDSSLAAKSQSVFPNPLPSLSPGDSQPSSYTSGDELPDLESFFYRHPPGVKMQGVKRRKLNRTSLHSERTPAVTYNVRRNQRLPQSISRDQADEFDFPVSPPASIRPLVSSQHHQESRPVFKAPRGLRSGLPPTPLPSSELIDQENLTCRAVAATNAGTGDSESPVSDKLSSNASKNSSDGENEVRDSIARKEAKMTRGVLPASHAKIEMVLQAQRDKSKRKQSPPRTPDRGIRRRGVAHVRITRHTRSPASSCSSPVPIVLSEDDSHATESSNLPEPLSIISRRSVDRNPKRTSTGGPSSSNIIGEAIEDDDIDAMFLDSPRQTRPGPARKKLHVKPRGSWSVNRIQKRSWRVKPSGHPKILRHLDRPPGGDHTSFRAPKLSIVDMGLHCTDYDVPDFVRVARRTADGRLDQGRHSPTRKYLRFPAEEDSRVVSKVLHDWCQGSLQPRHYSIVKKTICQPLKQRSANVQKIPKVALKQSALPPSASVDPAPKATNQVRRRAIAKRQTSLDQIILRLSNRTQNVQDPPTSLISFATPSKARRWMRLRHSMDNHGNFRPAVLESSRERESRSDVAKVFRQRLMKFNGSEHYHNATDPEMPEHLGKNEASGDRLLPPQNTMISELAVNERAHSVRHPRRSRKRTPTRHNISSPKPCEAGAIEILESDSDNEPTTHVNHDASSGFFQGLKSYGSHYTVHFDVNPLPTGTYFSESTVIGSGMLLESLALRDIDFDTERRPTILERHNQIWRWGFWNQNVADELESLCKEILDSCSAQLLADNKYSRQGEALIKKINAFLSHSLSFADPVDRVSCVKHLLAQFSYLFEGVEAIETSGFSASQIDQSISIYSLLSIAIYQITVLAKDDQVSISTRADADALLTSSTKKALDLALRDRFDNFKLLIQDVQHMQDCVYGIHNGYAAVEALVIVRHLLYGESCDNTKFWSLVNQTLVSKEPRWLSNVSFMERSWESIFLLLPFLDFDGRGVLKVAKRKDSHQANWDPVKDLLQVTFRAYAATTATQLVTLNAYIRALLGRCFQLVKIWSWKRCETLIGVLFDFFAQHGLAPLRNEQTHGSPSFLEHLDNDPIIALEPSEQCFHIFLKIIAVGLQRLRQVYPPKKIRDIVWRLMPNHGRILRKEENILASDMAALRNHHDLLCTLYWVCPPEARPRLRVIQALVEIETSHREACHINIRSWASLLCFQLSRSESAEALVPFVEWYIAILRASLAQHGHARLEAERGAQEVMKNSAIPISPGVLESTISRNQLQFEALLLDLLTCLKRAVTETANLEVMHILLRSELTYIFELMCKSDKIGQRRPQVEKATTEVLEIITICSRKTFAAERPNGPPTNDDSQEYGDWSELVENFVGVESAGPSKAPTAFESHLYETFQGPLRSLISNLFGSDDVPDNSVLQAVTEVWISLGVMNTTTGLRTWDDYIAPYGKESWASLRETEQTKKFAAFYWSKLIDHDKGIYSSYRWTILRHYFTSLVERESLLKFQHQFTNSLLNAYEAEPLLDNPPFWKNASGRFEVSLSDFSSRRMPLISSILSNMRVRVENPDFHVLAGSHSFRAECKGLLQHMMTAMKRNYQDLGQGSSGARGSYVGFVHNVIEMLQQYTVLICPIDRFFTDSEGFPLPEADPNYVVGQLRHCALRLHDPKTPKQLAIFLQSVSERAVAEGQEAYLIGQLHTAMSDAFESGSPKTATLRNFLLNNLAAPYIEAAFSSPCGALIATPLLQSLQPVLQQLLQDVDGTNDGSLDSAVAMLGSIFGSMAKAIHNTPSLLLDNSRLRVLAVCFSVMTGALPSCDYIVRLGTPALALIDALKYIRKSALEFLSNLLQEDVGNDSITISPIKAFQSTSSPIQSFAAAELKSTLQKNWRHHEGRYYVMRGNDRREVNPKIGTIDEENRRLLVALDIFFSAYEGIQYPNEND